MAKDDVTTKFKVDISDLKKNITEANKQIKLANAEFKAASAGMENWQKSTDGITKKLEQLDKVVNSQKSVLSAYKEQLERQQAAYEENGKKAEELKSKLQDLANNGIAKTSDEYKKYADELSAIEKAQSSNESAIEKLNTQILNQEAAVKTTESEISKYSQALSDTEAAEQRAATTGESVEDALKAIQNSAQQTGGAYADLKSKIDEQEATLANLKDQYKNYIVSEDEAGDEAQQLASQINQLSAELAENKAKANEADKAVDDLGDSVEEAADNTSGFGGVVDSLKVAFGNLIADGIRLAISAMQDFVKETLDAGKNFETQMSKVGAISGANADEMARLGEKAKEMGAKTKFSASEAGAAFEYMSMAGWKSEQMIDGIEGVMNLAAASGEDLATTSDIVTDAMTAFGLSAEESAHFADVLAKTSSNANTNVGMMGETFKYVAPVAGSMGYSIEDTSLAIGLMANSGIKASQAGTALRGMMTRLAKPTKESATAMDRLGFSLTDEAGNMKSLKDVLIDLRQEFNDLGLSEEEYNEKVTALTEERDKMLAREGLDKKAINAINKTYAEDLAELDMLYSMNATELQAMTAAQLAGQNAMSGMLAIVNASDEDFEKLAAAIDNADGAAEEMANTMIDNLEGDMTILNSQLEGLQLQLYDKFSPALRDAAKTMQTSLMPAISEMIEGIKGSDRKVAAALGDVISKGFKAFSDGLPAGITLLADVVDGLIEGLLDALPTIIDSLINALSQLIESLSVIMPKISEKVAEMLPIIIDTIVDGIPTLLNAAIKFFTAIVQAVPKISPKLLDALPKLVSSVADMLVKNAPTILKSAVQLFMEILKALPQIMPALAKAVVDLVGAIGGWLLQEAPALGKAGLEMLMVIVDQMPEVIDSMQEALLNLLKIIGDVFIAPLGDTLSNAWDKLIEGAAAAWDGVQNVFSTVGNFFKTTFENAWTAIKTVFSAGGMLFDGIKDGIVGAFTAIVDSLIQGINAVISDPFKAINDLLNKIRNSDILGVKPFESLWQQDPLPVPQIPLLAEGGVLRKGQIGLLEGDGAEAVVPLEKNKAWIKAVADDMVKTLQAVNAANNSVANSSSYNFVQNNYSPKSLSRLEIYRQTKNQIAMLQGAGM